MTPRSGVQPGARIAGAPCSLEKTSSGLQRRPQPAAQCHQDLAGNLHRNPIYEQYQVVQRPPASLRPVSISQVKQGPDQNADRIAIAATRPRIEIHLPMTNTMEIRPGGAAPAEGTVPAVRAGAPARPLCCSTPARPPSGLAGAQPPLAALRRIRRRRRRRRCPAGG